MPFPGCPPALVLTHAPWTTPAVCPMHNHRISRPLLFVILDCSELLQSSSVHFIYPYNLYYRCRIGPLKAALGRKIKETICLSTMKMQMVILWCLKGGFQLRHELNLFEKTGIGKAWSVRSLWAQELVSGSDKNTNPVCWEGQWIHKHCRQFHDLTVSKPLHKVVTNKFAQHMTLYSAVGEGPHFLGNGAL